MALTEVQRHKVNAEAYRNMANKQTARAHESELALRLVTNAYEAIAAHEKQMQEAETLREMQEAALVQKLCWQADMALLRHQLMESQQKPKPLIYR